MKLRPLYEHTDQAHDVWLEAGTKRRPFITAEIWRISVDRRGVAYTYCESEWWLMQGPGAEYRLGKREC